MDTKKIAIFLAVVSVAVVTIIASMTVFSEKVDERHRAEGRAESYNKQKAQLPVGRDKVPESAPAANKKIKYRKYIGEGFSLDIEDCSEMMSTEEQGKDCKFAANLFDSGGECNVLIFVSDGDTELWDNPPEDEFFQKIHIAEIKNELVRSRAEVISITAIKGGYDYVLIREHNGKRMRQYGRFLAKNGKYYIILVTCRENILSANLDGIKRIADSFRLIDAD